MSYNPWVASAPPQLNTAVPSGQQQSGMDQCYNLQWQAYQQQYAQWNAQYGEQFRKEMAAKHGANAVNIPGYSAPITYGTAAAVVTTPNAAGLAAAIAQPPPPPPPEEDRPPAPGEQVIGAHANDINVLSNQLNNENSSWNDNRNSNWNNRGSKQAQTWNTKHVNQYQNQFQRNPNHNNNRSNMSGASTMQNQSNNQNRISTQRNQQWNNRNQNNQQNNQSWSHDHQNRGRNFMGGRNRDRNFMENPGNYNDISQNQDRTANNTTNLNNSLIDGRSAVRKNWDRDFNKNSWNDETQASLDVSSNPSDVDKNTADKGKVGFEQNVGPPQDKLDTFVVQNPIETPNPLTETSKNKGDFLENRDRIGKEFGNRPQIPKTNFEFKQEDEFVQRNSGRREQNWNDNFTTQGHNQSDSFGDDFCNLSSFSRDDEIDIFNNRGGRNVEDNFSGQGDVNNINNNPFRNRNTNQNFDEYFESRNQNDGDNNGGKRNRNPFDRGQTNRNQERNQRLQFNVRDGIEKSQSFEQNTRDQSSILEEYNSPEEKFFREQFNKWENDYKNWQQDNYNRLDRITFENHQRQFEEVRSQLMDKWDLMRKRKQQQNKPQEMGNTATGFSQATPKSSEERAPTPQEQKDTFDEDYDENYTNFEKKEIEKPKMSNIFNKSDGIPGLDLVPEEEKNEDVKEQKLEVENKSFIPSLFDIVIEKPIGFGKSIEITSDDEDEEENINETEEKTAIDNVEKTEEAAKSEIPANVLQDPKLLGMLSAALATAKGQPPASATTEDSDSIISQTEKQNQSNQDNIKIENCQNDRFDNFRRENHDILSNRSVNFDNQGQSYDGRYDGSGETFDRGYGDRLYGGENQFRDNRFKTGGEYSRFDDHQNKFNDRGIYDSNDFQRSRSNVMQSFRSSNMPRGRYNDLQGRRYKNMQGGNYSDIHGGRLNDMQGEIFDEIHGSRFNDMQCGRYDERFNNQSNRFNDMRGSRFDKQGRFDDRGARSKCFDDYRGFEDNRRDQRNPFANPSYVDNRRKSGSSFDTRRDEDFFQPAKIIDYGNKPVSRFNSIDTFVPAKVIDHSNAKNISNADQDNYFPMKTIDYSQKNTFTDKEPKLSVTETSSSRKRTTEAQRLTDDIIKKDKPNDVEHTSKASSVPAEEPIEIKDEQIEKFTNPEAPVYPTYFGTSIRHTIKTPILPIQITNNLKPTISAQERKLFFEQQIADLEQNQRKPTNNPVVLQANASSKPQNVYPSYENSNTITVDEILLKPGRLTRPKNIVVILRGPPGSGKSYVAKLMKQKETEQGSDKSTPRILSIDDYFMIEDDIEEKCPKTGRKITRKEINFEYDKKMENTYMQYLIKAFKKNIENGLFKFIIIDCCNSSLVTFTEFYNVAKDAGYTPYTVDLFCDIDFCLKHNIHNRSKEDIKNIIDNWNPTPFHYIKLDVTSLSKSTDNVQDIIDVDMEDVSDCEEITQNDKKENLSQPVESDDDDSDSDSQFKFDFLKSKWDDDEKKLERLDGTVKFHKRKASTMSEYLQLDDWVPTTCAKGKKRVRWADIEEKREQEKMRAIGFVVGQTDWNRMMDPTSGSNALIKTKYIERANRGRSVR